MGYYNFKKKLEGKDQSIDKMIAKLDKIEKLISSELSSKIKNSLIENSELLIEIEDKD